MLGEDLAARDDVDAGTLGGSASASIDHLTWNGGLMADTSNGIGNSTATLSGSGTVTNATSYKYLDRRLNVAGTLTFANSSGYDLVVFQFAQPVTLAQISMGYVNTDSDFSLFAFNPVTPGQPQAAGAPPGSASQTGLVVA